MLYFQNLLKILHATNEISNSSKFELQQEKIEAYEAAQRINKIVFDELEREGFPVIHKKGFRYIETDDEYYQVAENIVLQDVKKTSEEEEILDETFEKTSDDWDVMNYEFGENSKKIKDKEDKEDKKDVEDIGSVDAVDREAVKNESDNNEDDEDCQEFDFDMYMNHHSETLSSKQNKVSESVSESNNSNSDNTSIDEFNFDSYLNHQFPDSVSISETGETKEDTENMTVSDSQNKTEEVHVEKESETHLENSDNIENIGQNETTLLQDKIEASEPEIDNQETKESDMISKTDIESEEPEKTNVPESTSILDKQIEHVESEKPEKTNVPESTGILDEQIEHVESEEQLSRPDTNEEVDIKSEENKEDEEVEVETETDNEEEDDDDDDDNNISSMLKYDFTLIYYQLYIRNKEHKTVARIELVTSPLYLTEDSRNILVWCQYDRENIVKSSGQNKHEVLIPVGDFGLIVDGIYKDGKFDSHIKLRKLDTDNGFYLYERRKAEFGTKGHIIISDEDVVIHVVPSSFKNNKTGNADFFYCIEVGDEREVGYARGVDHIPFSIDETPYDLVCRWNDDVLHSMVTSPGTMNLK